MLVLTKILSRTYALSLLSVIPTVCFHIGIAHSMTFVAVPNDRTPEVALFAQGLIERGDAERFIAALPNATKDKDGNVVLFLESPGGSVIAALQMVAVMDDVGVTTVVGKDSYCASACAAVLWVSGKHRDVLDGGKLGFHSCYQTNGEAIVNPKDDICNDAIGQNAFLHGVDYGDVVMWASSYGPDDMAWMGREIACYELAICKE
jgi:hypothetical protein